MADWTWQPTIGDDIATKGLVLSVALGIGAAGCLGAAIFMADVRYLVVVGFMLASLVWLGRSSTRQLRSLLVTVDGGIATLKDSHRTTTIDLRTVDSVDVSSRGDYQARARWAVEAVGAGTAIEHRIANVEQYWSLGTDQIDELRRGLQHYHQWYRANAAPTPVATGAGGQDAIAGRTQPAAAGQTVAGEFEWRMPRHPNADRNQRRVAVVTVSLAAALAAAGIAASWPDALGVLLSIVVLPGLVGLLGGGLWWAYTPVRRFRMTAADGVLFVHPTWGSKAPREVPLAGAGSVVVDTSTNLVATGTGGHTRQTTTYIQIDSERIALPSGPGSSMNSEQRLLLESQLRRLAGIA